MMKISNLLMYWLMVLEISNIESEYDINDFTIQIHSSWMVKSMN